MSPPKPRGKDLSNLAPTDAVGDAARFTLDLRLNDVERLLSDAVARGSGEMKPIHRLRVSTRRASAALRVFKEWIPKGQRKGVDAGLRKIRQTAGEARMCDVQLEQFDALLGSSGGEFDTALGVVIGRIVESREHAGAAVRALGKDKVCGSAALARSHESLLGSIGGPKCKAAKAGRAPLPLETLASEQLPVLVGQMEDAGHEDLSVVDHVHALRIVGKRVRYATEIFECCFEPSAHGELLGRLTDFQDHLGAMNDLWEMIGRVERYGAAAPMKGTLAAAIGGLRVELAGRFEQAHREFLAWWSERGIEGVVSGLSIPGRATLRVEGEGGGSSVGTGGGPSSIIEGTARHSA